MQGFYDRLSQIRKDSPELTKCVKETVDKLLATSTTLGKPGMLLGKIQSGKTMAFLGIIAKGFDEGFDIAIVLTKGTKALSAQTVARLRKDYADFEKDDELKIFDIMSMPTELSPYETRQKLIFVAKKQHQNLQRIIDLFKSDKHTFSKRKVLLVDDEADLASVRFVQKRGADEVDQGKIADQIDHIRKIVADIAFLQVTATPYALYLQPDEYTERGDGFAFLPKKPAFTVLLPIHSKYVGGDDYFGDFDDTDPRAYLYAKVPLEEQDVLRNRDGRRTKSLMTSNNIRMLRFALLNFLTGVVIRHWQMTQAGQRPNKKFSLIIHNDTRKEAHDWQWETVGDLLDLFASKAKTQDADLRELFNECYSDLSRSVLANGDRLPDADYCFVEICKALVGGDVMREKVNSDKEVGALLDENSELKLRTPYNIFIGGNILDRGITIPNLMGFYYGRNPKTMQADTVLQHSRMYGSRDRSDLAVTRFYTSKIVYDRLKKIHELEVTLRQAFESGAHERGVVFIQSDTARRVIPCAPSKIKMSEVCSIRPGGRLLPIDFQNLPKYKSEKIVANIDSLIPANVSNTDTPIKITTDLAHSILDLIEQSLEFDKGGSWDWRSMHAAIDYFTKDAPDKAAAKIWLLSYTDRSISRIRQSGRFSNAPDTKQQREIAEAKAVSEPMLLLLRQRGDKDDGWAGAPFWWPVFIAPSAALPCVYAEAA